ncbi:hypothetical protein EDC45_2049 [Mesocricetibacter intestinalis]|uniref:Purine nucleoside phosphorylase n=1 Tax=Mesocricetibacter intestinalis TaxID=1521930 RepID=A0A4R6V6E5_9PAST|nr:peptidoglycan editing factor PgeF [Mesocricetibacter intestinalis]TDQ56227.1 hypothetical protein EDC45_2049 [Mesocricetibacter intestinalis]
MNALIPQWQAAANIRAFTTLRYGGVSKPPFDSFNLADHVGDDKNSVKNNRTLLYQQFRLPHWPLFLNQVHGTRVISLPYTGTTPEADAVYSNKANQICLVMTADCLPVLFCNRQGTEVAAAHAGWRGLCEGVLERTLSNFNSPPSEILAWLGPAIGPNAFQVGAEVIERFARQDENARQAFIPDPHTAGKYLGDLYQIARQRLNRLGLTEISGGEQCTYQEKDKFFSFRRDRQTGRMASLIWFE